MSVCNNIFRDIIHLLVRISIFGIARRVLHFLAFLKISFRVTAGIEVYLVDPKDIYK